jgi:hypothetical protein
MEMPYSAPATLNGTEPGSDQVDAEGEDEDEDDDLDLEVVPASNNGPLDTSSHGLPLQPTPVHPTQMHAHLQSHAQAQAQHAHAQAQAQAHVQAQVWAATRQHMNQSRNQHHHAHQQISPVHQQHMGSAANSRRQSAVMVDTHSMNTGGMLPMDGIESHTDQFLRMDMGLSTGYVGSSGDGVSGAPNHL